jgi:hypothetical protein
MQAHHRTVSSKLYRVAFVVALVIDPSLKAQDAFAPIQLGQVTFTGSVRDRVENWEWFTPASRDPKYTFDGNTIRLGISENLKSFDWMAEIETPILLWRIAPVPLNLAGRDYNLAGLGSYLVNAVGDCNVATAVARLHSSFTPIARAETRTLARKRRSFDAVSRATPRSAKPIAQPGSFFGGRRSMRSCQPKSPRPVLV